MITILMFGSEALCAGGDLFATITVVDEHDASVSGVHILASVLLPDSPSRDGAYYRVDEIFEGSSPIEVKTPSVGKIIVQAQRPGFYSYRELYLFRSVDNNKNRYLPWGKHFQVVLKARLNPRPLFVHRVDWMSVPEFGKPIGFDLEKADWVAPYGGGIHGDFFFTLNRKLGQGEVYEGTMDLSFTAPMDGIRLVDGQGGATSELLLGREAPLDGYQPVYSRSVGVSEEGGRLKLLDDPSREELEGYAGFWFRVRSVVNEETGELVRARYGKIDGFIDFAVRAEDEPAHIRFVYYLSPDDSPSLEFNGESLVENADLQGVTKH